MPQNQLFRHKRAASRNVRELRELAARTVHAALAPSSMASVSSEQAQPANVTQFRLRAPTLNEAISLQN